MCQLLDISSTHCVTIFLSRLVSYAVVFLSAMTANDFVYMINTGPETPYMGKNNGETNEHTSQVSCH